MNVVASPDYLARHARPETPQDLEVHNCIRLRFPSGEFLPWRFIIEGETLELDVKGSLIANDADLLVHVALNTSHRLAQIKGCGFAKQVLIFHSRELSGSGRGSGDWTEDTTLRITR